MRNKFMLFILALMTWIVVSFIFCTNKLSSDGLFEFGFPLVVYSSFNGKGQSESLELGINIINLAITVGFLLIFLEVLNKIIKNR
jgi:TRAP-type C4-dicarboxylate transport system permease small subunit